MSQPIVAPRAPRSAGARPRPRVGPDRGRLALVAILGLMIAGCAGTVVSPSAGAPAATEGPSPTLAASEQSSPTVAASPSPTPIPTASPLSPAPSRSATGALDPCALLTPSEAAAALGVASVVARPDPSAAGFCTFGPGSGPASISVGVNTDLPQMVVFGLQGTSVAGLGQQAIVGNGVIGVLVSQKLGLSIRGTLPNGSALSDAALTDLARKALARAA